MKLNEVDLAQIWSFGPTAAVCGITLTKGKVAWVDAPDFERSVAIDWRAKKAKAGLWYAVTGGFKEEVELGSFLLGHVRNHQTMVDHVNGDGLDNRRDNLRVATQLQNNWNQGKRPARSKVGAPYSQHKGVYWNSTTGKWIAQIRIGGGKRLHLGLFQDQIAAALAYNKAAKEHHGQFAKLNFSGPDLVVVQPVLEAA